MAKSNARRARDAAAAAAAATMTAPASNVTILPTLPREDVEQGPREPTAEEIAETSALQGEAERKATSFAEGAALAAVKAAKGATTATYDAVSALALNLCGEQLREILTNGLYEPNRAEHVFKRDVLFMLAKEGEMIWRGTEAEAANCAKLAAEHKAARGKDAKATALAALNAAAIAYVNTKGLKPTEFPAKLRKYGFQLAAIYRDNHKDVLIEAAKCETYDGAAKLYGDHLARTYPTAWNAFADRLDAIREAGKAPRKAKAAEGGDASQGTGDEVPPMAGEGKADAPKVDKVAAIMGMVEGLDGAEFASLMFRLKAEYEARKAEGAKADAAPAVIALPARKAA